MSKSNVRFDYRLDARDNWYEVSKSLISSIEEIEAPARKSRKSNSVKAEFSFQEKRVSPETAKELRNSFIMEDNVLRTIEATLKEFASTPELAEKISQMKIQLWSLDQTVERIKVRSTGSEPTVLWSRWYRRYHVALSA